MIVKKDKEMDYDYKQQNVISNILSIYISCLLKIYNM